MGVGWEGTRVAGRLDGNEKRREALRVRQVGGGHVGDRRCARPAWGYDKVGRAVTVIRPGGGTEQRSYDVSGNLVSVTTPRLHVIGMGYDAMNRMTTRTVPPGNRGHPPR